jgi:hypothetical protein
MGNPDTIIYNYLGRSHNIAPDEELWVICGDYEEGEGILAWCYNEEDAAYGAGLFDKSPRFNRIHYHKYIKESKT